MADAKYLCYKACAKGCFSLLDYSIEADFSTAEYYVHKIVKSVLDKKFGKHFLLNVNIPATPRELMNGIKVCR